MRFVRRGEPHHQMSLRGAHAPLTRARVNKEIVGATHGPADRVSQSGMHWLSHTHGTQVRVKAHNLILTASNGPIAASPSGCPRLRLPDGEAAMGHFAVVNSKLDSVQHRGAQKTELNVTVHPTEPQSKTECCRCRIWCLVFDGCLLFTL